MRSLILAVFLLSCAAAWAAPAERHASPDAAVEAIVSTAPPRGAGTGESKVTLRTRDGRVLAARRFVSPDGAHGYRVERAAWTPDSQFFVFSLASSGGHQPWRFPTYFFSRRDGRMRLLDDFVGPVASPDFELRAPDILVLPGDGERTSAGSPLPIRLHELRQPGRQKPRS